MMNDDILEIEDENGVVKKYSILFKFDELDSNEHYVVYTDYSMDESGNVDVKARQYIEEDGVVKLNEIKYQEVKDYIKNKLKELMNEEQS